MNFQFRKMRPKKSYQHVVEEIQTAICDGSIKKGDKLPSEMKLKELFDTSRGTVREALRVLEQKGLVSIKTGVKGGAIVQEADTKPMQDSVGILIRQQKVSLDHLAEFRTMIEGYISEQAAKMAEPDEIRALKELLKKADAHIRTKPSGWKRFHELDARFHILLAKIAKNPLLEANLTAVHDNVQIYFHTYLPFSEALLKDNFKDLCRIVEAIEQKDSLTAGKIAQMHVAKFNALMETHTR